MRSRAAPGPESAELPLPTPLGPPPPVYAPPPPYPRQPPPVSRWPGVEGRETGGAPSRRGEPEPPPAHEAAECGGGGSAPSSSGATPRAPAAPLPPGYPTYVRPGGDSTTTTYVQPGYPPELPLHQYYVPHMQPMGFHGLHISISPISPHVPVGGAAA